MTNTAPMLALALRQAIAPAADEAAPRSCSIPRLGRRRRARGRSSRSKGPLFIATPDATQAGRRRHADAIAPRRTTWRGWASPSPTRLDPTRPAVPDLPDEVARAGGGDRRRLNDAERPLVVSGAGCGSEARAAGGRERRLGAARARASRRELCFTVPECNSLGAGADGRRRASMRRSRLCATGGRTRSSSWRTTSTGARTRDAVDALLDARQARHRASIISPTRRPREAEVVLPAATFAEATARWSTTRAARSASTRSSPRRRRPGELALAARLMAAAGRSEASGWHDAGRRRRRRWRRALPVFAPVAGHRAAGRLPRGGPEDAAPAAALQRAHGDARQRQTSTSRSRRTIRTRRWRSRWRAIQGQPPPALIPRFWAPGWNSVQALNKFQDEVGGPLRGGDPGRRLIEPARDGRRRLLRGGARRPSQPRAGEWLVVPAASHLRLGGAERARARRRRAGAAAVPGAEPRRRRAPRRWRRAARSSCRWRARSHAPAGQAACRRCRRAWPALPVGLPGVDRRRPAGLGHAETPARRRAGGPA